MNLQFGKKQVSASLKELHFKEDTSKPENRVNLTLFHLLMNNEVKSFIFSKLHLDPACVVYPAPNLVTEEFDTIDRPDFKIEKNGQLVGYIEVKHCLEKLHKARKLPKFDFIIVDEAQDLFDKGIDLVLKYLLKPDNAIENGSYYIFFDNSQAFPKAKDLKVYVQTRDALKKYSASYLLFSNLRVNTGLGLTDLISDAGMGHVNFSPSYGEDVVTRECNTHQEISTVLKQLITQEKLLGKCTPDDMIILLTADLLKEDSPFKTVFKADQQYEMLTLDNVDSTSKKTRYSTALKVKGLEWNVVFIICSSLADKKNLFQLFIGASRARVKVYIVHC